MAEEPETVRLGLGATARPGTSSARSAFVGDPTYRRPVSVLGRKDRRQVLLHSPYTDFENSKASSKAFHAAFLSKGKDPKISLRKTMPASTVTEPEREATPEPKKPQPITRLNTANEATAPITLSNSMGLLKVVEEKGEGVSQPPFPDGKGELTSDKASPMEQYFTSSHEIPLAAQMLLPSEARKPYTTSTLQQLAASSASYRQSVAGRDEVKKERKFDVSNFAPPELDLSENNQVLSNAESNADKEWNKLFVINQRRKEKEFLKLEEAEAEAERRFMESYVATQLPPLNRARALPEEEAEEWDRLSRDERLHDSSRVRRQRYHADDVNQEQPNFRATKRAVELLCAHHTHIHQMHHQPCEHRPLQYKLCPLHEPMPQPEPEPERAPPPPAVEAEKEEDDEDAKTVLYATQHFDTQFRQYLLYNRAAQSSRTATDQEKRLANPALHQSLPPSLAHVQKQTPLPHACVGEEPSPPRPTRTVRNGVPFRPFYELAGSNPEWSKITALQQTRYMREGAGELNAEEMARRHLLNHYQRSKQAQATHCSHLMRPSTASSVVVSTVPKRQWRYPKPEREKPAGEDFEFFDQDASVHLSAHGGRNGPSRFRRVGGELSAYEKKKLEEEEAKKEKKKVKVEDAPLDFEFIRTCLSRRASVLDSVERQHNEQLLEPLRKEQGDAYDAELDESEEEDEEEVEEEDEVEEDDEEDDGGRTHVKDVALRRGSVSSPRGKIVVEDPLLAKVENYLISDKHM